MSATPSPKRKRERRSQQQRSSETRAKVIQAATECVAALGVKGATMSAIAARAGVTWGAMQHQFGDKDSILDAVLEQCLTDLEAQFAKLPASEPRPTQRLHAFVLRSSRLLDGPSYPAFVEIQLARGRSGDATDDSWAEYAASTLERVWVGVFGDLDISRRKLMAAQRFFFVVMSGIAAESMLFPFITSAAKSHFAALEGTLLRLLEIDE
jgi:AcrR family transcriptional regulator